MAGKRIVIVGAGHAGVQAAASLRDEGFGGEIELISAESALPYHRPPLSKRFAEGLTDEAIALRPAAFYAAQDIRLRRGKAVEEIDVRGQRLKLGSGKRLAYDHLILATGSRNRSLAVPGEELDGIVSIRDLGDAYRLASSIVIGTRAFIVGAGYLGLEVAAALARHGVKVTIAAARPLPLGRSVSPETARMVVAGLRDMGIETIVGTGIAGFEGNGRRVTGVRLGDGSLRETELAVVGIGAVPDVGLAKYAGLDVDNGILVDEALATSAANISAIGDCARIRGCSRLESVASATFQARCIAARLCGRPAPAAETPWFWSDIGDLRLKMAGLKQPDDAVRTLAVDGGHVALCFRNGQLAAVETINANRIHVAARRILDAGIPLEMDAACAPDFDMVVHARALAARSSAAPCAA
ncbi:3-phenylpropionate/trans-cinnamate dioxygenase ferredoxin reductase subunit [Aminobacter aminovorans]|uniref:Rhodocoxin reductase n=1 Tax=Aminobacter aminovorans TaxID=83263 RepID=A0A380WRG3_AMIAI|nr:FAD-dependent oxidoreductase [Aminobacter aminovorans]TCS23581.1 3-phenylpropionate/trans-cinnamate dioxygenase ferredoxin reductase subunit [Aminobacter aminovorans]SUU91547.1 Rhodocoxin reductase [Aminobacter aminovorans]